VVEGERHRVQCEVAEARTLGLVALVAVAGFEGGEEDGRGGAVEWIGDDGAADRGEMDAELVRAACLGTTFDEGETEEAFENGHVGHSWLASGVNPHAPRDAGILAEQLADGESFGISAYKEQLGAGRNGGRCLFGEG